MTPLIVFDRPDGQRRTVVMPDEWWDRIGDPARACHRLKFLAREHSVDATVAAMDSNGAVRLLKEREAA